MEGRAPAAAAGRERGRGRDRRLRRSAQPTSPRRPTASRWPVFFDKSDELEEFDRIAIAADPAREAIADYWKSPDVNFQNTFTSSMTTLGIGLTYKFL